MYEKITKLNHHPSGLTNQTINDVSNYCMEHFKCQLPEGYVEFLKESNGFIYNGYAILSCYNDDIIDNFPVYEDFDVITDNFNFIENTGITDYFFIGRSSIDYLVYKKSTQEYVLLSNGVLDEFYKNRDFKETLFEFFNVK